MMDRVFRWGQVTVENAGMKYDQLSDMKTLIVSIHYPEKAKEFIAYSIRLANYLRSELVFLYVEEPGPSPAGAADIAGWANAEIQRSFVERARRAKETLMQFAYELQNTSDVMVNISFSAEWGKESDLLQHMTETDPASKMVIVENYEEDILWIKNGKTRSIISSVKCPVWVNPGISGFVPIQQVVYLSDYNKEDITVLKSLLGFMETFDPQITALHVTNDLDFDEKIRQAGFKEILKTKTSSEKLTVETLIENEHEDLATAISDYCREAGTDLIVVKQENAGFWERVFRESPAVKLMKQIELPILIFSGE